MAYVYTLVVIFVIGFVIYRMIMKKSTPSNHYTPFDDMTMGNKIDMKHDSPIEDTKHAIHYEEKVVNKEE